MRRGDEYRIGERQEQSFERAVDYYHRAARRNYAPAQYMMGIMYESGHGVPQSYKEAAKWYEKAFNQGYRRATSAMAFLWESGLGVKRSRSLAIEHYSTAAEGGDLRAYNNLGLIYRDRNGSEHNDHGAVVFFQKGNIQEFYPCQCNLASMYEKGLDVKRDCETASTLFKKGADKQNTVTIAPGQQFNIFVTKPISFGI